MKKYDFKTDLKRSELGLEKVISWVSEKFPNIEVIIPDNDRIHDLELKWGDTSIKVEVKSDFMAEKTGNLAFEEGSSSSKGWMPGGGYKALRDGCDAYLFVVGDEIFFFEPDYIVKHTELLKQKQTPKEIKNKNFTTFIYLFRLDERQHRIDDMVMLFFSDEYFGAYDGQ